MPRYQFEAFRLYEDARAVGSESNEIAPWTLDAPAYFCRDHSLKDAIYDEQRANNQLGEDLEIKTVENLTQAVLLNFEVLSKTKFFGTGTPVNGTTLSGTSQWSDYTNSDPITAIENARVQIKQAVAKAPNTFAVSFPVHVKLRQHPLIIDRFKYTNPAGMLSVDQLKSVFEVDNYWVMGAEYDANLEGLSTAPSGAFTPTTGTTSLNFVWAKNALLAYVSPLGKLETIIGYQPRWLFGAPELGGTLVKRYRWEPKTGDVVEVHRYHDAVFLVAGAAYTFTNAVA